MKIVNEVSNGITPRAGCVCSEGWKSTRGLWQPPISCKCNCTGNGSATSRANRTLANEASD